MELDDLYAASLWKQREQHYNHRSAWASLRCINFLHAPEVAHALRSVSQVLAFIVNPVSCLFITQVLLQLMLCSSV